MNYKSQLRGWAVDRVIELWKIAPEVLSCERSLGMLQEQADKLAAYAYVPREDLETTAKDLFDLVRNAAPNESSADSLIATLEHIKHERISQGIDTANDNGDAA